MSMTFWTPVTIAILFSGEALLSDDQISLTSLQTFGLIVIGVLYVAGTYMSFVGWSMTDPVISSMLYQTQVVFTLLFSILLGVATNVGILKFIGVLMVLSGVCAYQYLDSLESSTKFKDLDDV